MFTAPKVYRSTIPTTAAELVLRHGRLTHDGHGALAFLPSTLSHLMPSNPAVMAEMAAERRGLSVAAVETEWKTMALMSTSIRDRLKSSLRQQQPTTTSTTTGGVGDMATLAASAPAVPTGGPWTSDAIAPFLEAADAAAAAIKEQYTVLATDILACDTDYEAGTLVDVVLQCKATGRPMVVVLRVTGSGESDFFLNQFQTPCVRPLGHLPNTAYTKAGIRAATASRLMWTSGWWHRLLGEAEAERLLGATAASAVDGVQMGQLLLMPGLLTPVKTEFALLRHEHFSPAPDAGPQVSCSRGLGSVVETVLHAAMALKRGATDPTTPLNELPLKPRTRRANKGKAHGAFPADAKRASRNREQRSRNAIDHDINMLLAASEKRIGRMSTARETDAPDARNVASTVGDGESAFRSDTTADIIPVDDGHGVAVLGDVDVRGSDRPQADRPSATDAPPTARVRILPRRAKKPAVAGMSPTATSAPVDERGLTQHLEAFTRLMSKLRANRKAKLNVAAHSNEPSKVSVAEPPGKDGCSPSATPHPAAEVVHVRKAKPVEKRLQWRGSPAPLPAGEDVVDDIMAVEPSLTGPRRMQPRDIREPTSPHPRPATLAAAPAGDPTARLGGQTHGTSRATSLPVQEEQQRLWLGVAALRPRRLVINPAPVLTDEAVLAEAKKVSVLAASQRSVHDAGSVASDAGLHLGGPLNAAARLDQQRPTLGPEGGAIHPRAPTARRRDSGE